MIMIVVDNFTCLVGLMDTDGLDTAIRASEFPGVVVVRHAEP